MPNATTTLRLISPLFPHLYRKNEYGDLENEPEDLSPHELLSYQEQIKAAIASDRSLSDNPRGLAEYLHDAALQQKIISILPSVEERDGALWGVTEVQLGQPLTPQKLEQLTDWLEGQFADGWGEGFEQKAIPIPEGELCISFWDGSDQFFIKPEDELDSPPFGFHISM